MKEIINETTGTTKNIQIDENGNIVMPQLKIKKCHWYKHNWDNWSKISEGDILVGGLHRGKYVNLEKKCISCGLIKIKRIEY